MIPSYLETLKAFVEGEKDLRSWPAWWLENASLIEAVEGHARYLKIKLEWREGACQILAHHGVPFQLNAEVNWDRCKTCGEPLFHAVPDETTPEQITAFARNSNLPNKEQIARAGWIHPGTFCPNGCTAVLVSYREDSA